MDRMHIVLACLAIPALLRAQEPAKPRHLSAAETGWVRQLVYQVFTYHSDGRTDVSQ